MKTPLLYLSLLFFFQFEGRSFAQASTSCPQQVLITIECAANSNDFQLLKHIGRYTEPKTEWSNQQMVCSYGASEWVSKYKLSDQSGERVVSVSSLHELSAISKYIRQKGFDVGPKDHINPFTMVTYKPNAQKYTADQMFLFSGLESTFGKDNFTVAAVGNHRVSTAVINDRYLKSQDVAADAFVTGSNCSILIK